jgi:hypothetical protein
MTAIKRQAHIISRWRSVCAVARLLNVVGCRGCRVRERYFELPPPPRGWPTRTGSDLVLEAIINLFGEKVLL